MKSLTLNTDKTKLQNSQGFSRNNYPPVGEPAFGAEPTQQRQEIIVVPIMPATPDQNQTPRQNPDQEQNQDQNLDQGQKPPSTPSPDSSNP